ncbi:hypothetical protein N0K08_07060 [Acidovorax sp. Be4]|uniref:Uncharacterized protein n=1 Tax=Acidovorax bellezanensis TaxID=2976702 RepID=A0ABT2PIS1_9BURK|nr:hypothetical protein [Acidovorax sp. Be4]MCT9810385.1 hypothetical protein [Acidovorax sp. Be4]
MGLLNSITKPLIEVIEWTNDARHTLSYRWPDEDKEIKGGAQRIVRASQQVQGPVRRPVPARQTHAEHAEQTPCVDTQDGKYDVQSPLKKPREPRLHRQPQRRCVVYLSQGVSAPGRFFAFG